MYCDFYSITDLTQLENYISALCKEIKNYSNLYSDKIIISSVYLGGGTPSVLPIKNIHRIFNVLKENFYFKKNAEFTIEVNPGTSLKSKFNQYLELGINRISIGVQSFNNKDLTFLSRIHNSKQAIKTI
ncbi:MAG: coproporphyrinogen III oxidase family protein, partial [Ignavibacteriales bacterium]|nr:coproporphyrinogen III oxidase family protein [Ignavibacteriales bacterium]